LRFILNISKQEQVSLAQELEGIDHYVKFEQLRFDQGFDFQLEVDLEQSHGRVAIQPMLIQPFLENAIWHGLKPLSEKGILK
jgi:LytS/YehU family sensor histidine kinase